MKFRKVVEIEASQYTPGKELPPGVIEEHGRAYIETSTLYYDIGEPERLQITLKGGEWIGQSAEIVNLDEWKQVDFQIKVNGCTINWPIETITFGQVVMLSGKRIVNVFLEGVKQLSPNETVKVEDGMSFIVL